MNEKYIVRLNDEERRELVEVITKLKGTSQKVKLAQILLKADADGMLRSGLNVPSRNVVSVLLRSGHTGV